MSSQNNTCVKIDKITVIIFILQYALVMCIHFLLLSHHLQFWPKMGITTIIWLIIIDNVRKHKACSEENIEESSNV